LLPAVNIWTSDQNTLPLTVLCATLWSYFGLQIFCAVSQSCAEYFLLFCDRAVHVKRRDCLYHGLGG